MTNNYTKYIWPSYLLKYKHKFVYKKIDNNNNESNKQKPLSNYYISMKGKNKKNSINVILRHLLL